MRKSGKWLALFLAAVVLTAGCDNRTAAGKTEGEQAEKAETEAASGTEAAGQKENAGEQEAGEEGPLTFADAFVELDAQDLEGNRVTSDIFDGYDLTMINLWGTFCGYCLDEMPALGELEQEYQTAGQSFQIVGVCSDAVKVEQKDDGYVFVPLAENVEKAKELVEETGADYLHLVPVNELGWSLTQTAEAAYVPMSIFVDRDGNCVSEYILGARSKEEWKKIIDAQLQEDGDES